MWQMNIKPQLVKWSCQPLNQNGVQQAFIKSHLLFIIQRIFGIWKCEFLVEIVKVWKEKKSMHLCDFVLNDDG